MYKCSYCDENIEQDEIYYVFNGLNVCEKCLPDHLIKYAETADYSSFDRYIVRGCKETDEEDSCIDIVADDEAEFYGVYLVKDDGLEEWVADFPIKVEAEDFARKHNQK